MADGTHSVSLVPTRGTPSLGGRYIQLVKPSREQASDDALNKLAAAMILPDSGDEARESHQNSVIPAGYTYFAQFVAHELSFDPSTTHQRRLDKTFREDYRTPRFDLDGLYGRGPVDQPYFYEKPLRRKPDEPPRSRKFVLGRLLEDSVYDVPRVTEPKGVALIGEPRNDQNAIVSQLHGAFLQFHNRLATEHDDWSFEEVQDAVRLHYQHVLLEDLLPRLVGTRTLQRMLQRTDTGYQVLIKPLFGDVDPVLPSEFALAAFRFGHSMVRSRYVLTRILPVLQTVAEDSLNSLVAFAKPMLGSWRIQWDLFLDLEGVKRPSLRDRLQMAYKIDASIAAPLNQLPPIRNLAARNLQAGKRAELASGQDVAAWLGIQPLRDEEILIGNVAEDEGVPIDKVDASFAGNAPLWAYILAEAHAARASDEAQKVQWAEGEHPRQLGELGGRLVAATFIRLLQADPSSILNLEQPFKPLYGKGKFGLGELITTALAPIS